ncbi:hypothetical protein [Paenibacillus glacialis]|uniref:Uncharacterized protein n=1 Tax=Paenibacillus glacialis TaxID=494026 RepID=A0A168HRK7_9BACL|nr:hypothetical protein [Paenibacillus glacialis]OAB38457.1 hypothetical protein PGLA_20410 [Paenibacillus glacialis]
MNRGILRGDLIDGQTLNRYAYVNGDPIRYIDPMGLMKGLCGDKIPDRDRNHLDRPTAGDNIGVNLRLEGKGKLDDDALVVRGGQSSPDNLLLNQNKDARGHISCNTGSNNLDELSTTLEAFKNGSLTVTTVGDIRRLGEGWDVIKDPTKNNSLHGSIIPPNTPLTKEQAEALSRIFNIVPNKWK